MAGHTTTGIMDLVEIQSLEQVHPKLQESTSKILAYAKGDNWERSGAMLPASFCASGDDTGEDFDFYSDQSKNEHLYKLWYLFNGLGSNRLNIMFRKMVKSPELKDQMDEIIGLFPVMTPAQAADAGKTVNETGVMWVEWQRQNGAMPHIARQGPGPRLQTTDKRIDRKETILPAGGVFTLPVNFLDTEQGQEMYLLEIDSTVESVRYTWVRQVLSTAVTVGLENLAQSFKSRLPLPRQELHSLLLEVAETKLTLSKDNNNGLEGLESSLAMNLLSQCNRNPDFLLLDPTIPNSVYALRSDTAGIEGAADPARRAQSMIPIGQMYKGGDRFRTLRERIQILNAPPIPDLNAGYPYHALQGEFVFGDFFAWLADPDAAVLENSDYRTSDRAITLLNGDTGSSETIQLEVPLQFAGIFLDGRLTWQGAAILRRIIEFRQYHRMHLSTGVWKQDSGAGSEQEWWKRSNVEVDGDSVESNVLWSKIQIALQKQDMFALDNTIEHSNIPASLSLFNLVKSAGYLERYRKDLGRMSPADLSGLMEADRQASNGGSRSEGKQLGRRTTRAAPPLVPDAPIAAGNIDVIHLPTYSQSHPVHNILWPQVVRYSTTCVSFENNPEFIRLIRNEYKRLGGRDNKLSSFIELILREIHTRVLGANIPGLNRLHAELTEDGVRRAMDVPYVRKISKLLFFGGNTLPTSVDENTYKRSVISLLESSGFANTNIANIVARVCGGVDYPNPYQYYNAQPDLTSGIPEIMAFLGPTKVPALGNNAGSINTLCGNMRNFRFEVENLQFSNIQQFITNLIHADANDDQQQLVRAIATILGTQPATIDADAPFNALAGTQQPTFDWRAAVKRMADAGSRVPIMGAGGGGDVALGGVGQKSAEEIDAMLQGIKCSEDVFIWGLRKNVPFPMGFVGARINNRFRTAHAVAGLRTAFFTLMKSCDMTTALRQEHLDIIFAAHFRYCVVPENRHQITIIPDVKPLGYVYGSGTAFFAPTADARAAFNTGTLPPKNAQVLVMAVPARWKPDSAIMDLTGKSHPEMQVVDVNERLDYPTAAIYEAAWKGWGIRKNVHFLSHDNLKSSQRTSTLFRQSYYRYDRGQKILVEGQSPLGYEVKPMSYRVLRGGGVYGGNLEGSRRYSSS